MKSVNKKSITFVSPYIFSLISGRKEYGCGGAERQFFIFAKYLAKYGWKVSFISQHPVSSKFFNNNFLNYNFIFSKFFFLNGKSFLLFLDWCLLIIALFKSNSYFYVIKTPGHLAAPMSFFCNFFKRKLVFWTQSDSDAMPEYRKNWSPLISLLHDFGLKNSNIIISQTKSQRYAYSINYNIDASIVNNISCKITPPSLNKNIPFTHNDYVDVLWAGNSLPNKRYEIVIELAKLLPHRKFAIAMNKSDIKRFSDAYITASKLNNVLFLGELHPFDMENWFEKTRLFLNTSIKEGFANTFLQAWTNGVPVVSLCIDPDNIISSYGLGKVILKSDNLYLNEKNFQYLAKISLPIIESLLGNNRLMNTIKKNATQFIKENHSPKIVIPMLYAALGQAHNS